MDQTRDEHHKLHHFMYVQNRALAVNQWQNGGFYRAHELAYLLERYHSL